VLKGGGEPGEKRTLDSTIQSLQGFFICGDGQRRTGVKVEGIELLGTGRKHLGGWKEKATTDRIKGEQKDSGRESQNLKKKKKTEMQKLLKILNQRKMLPGCPKTRRKKKCCGGGR